MVNSIRYIAMAAGVLGVAGGAVFFGVKGTHTEPVSSIAMTLQDEPVGEICLKTDIQFFDGVVAECYSRSALLALRDAPLVNQNADRVEVAMSHPSDLSIRPARVENCRAFREMQWEGLYAMSSLDMRREAYFVRACGVLDMLIGAAPAQVSYFENGSPNEGEWAYLGQTAFLQISEGERERDGADPQSSTPENIGAYRWRMEGDGQKSILQEIANADFDGDRIEEILVFIWAGPEDGTASASQVGLLEKEAAGAPVVLTLQTFGPEKRGAAGP